jgi:hypothetical protein
MKHSPKKNPFHPFQHELDTFSTCFQHLFTAFRYSLFFFVFSRKSLCHRKGLGLRSTNQIQREFSSNVAIPTQNTILASSHPRQKTNLLKRDLPSLCAAEKGVPVTSRRRHRGILQTESKGNFCLMTLYSHKRPAVTSRRLLTPKNFFKNPRFFKPRSNPLHRCGAAFVGQLVLMRHLRPPHNLPITQHQHPIGITGNARIVRHHQNRFLALAG